MSVQSQSECVCNWCIYRRASAQKQHTAINDHIPRYAGYGISIKNAQTALVAASHRASATSTWCQYAETLAHSLWRFLGMPFPPQCVAEGFSDYLPHNSVDNDPGPTWKQPTLMNSGVIASRSSRGNKACGAARQQTVLEPASASYWACTGNENLSVFAPFPLACGGMQWCCTGSSMSWRLLVRYWFRPRSRGCLNAWMELADETDRF